MNENIVDIIKRLSIPLIQLSSHDLHDPEVISCIASRNESTVIYSGYGGVILRKKIFMTGKKFLHVHGGYLPDYKGSTTNYYSLLDRNNMGASSIFLEESIDCGPILNKKQFPPPEIRKDIDHLYDSIMRAKVLVETLKEYNENGQFVFGESTYGRGETYYIIHPVLKHISILSKK